MEYSIELFKRSTAEKISEYYVEILNQVVEDWDIKLKEIEISHNFVTIKSNLHHEDYDEFKF